MSAATVRTAFIDGVALWSPTLPGWEQAREVLAGRAPPAARSARPAPELLPPNERRRAPDSVAIALHAAMSACQHAQRDPASLRSVFTSMHGDLAITDYMCSTLATDAKLISPTKFHNSVHNAAAGYWSIGTGSTRPYTALSAGRFSFGAGLVESLLQLSHAREDVLFVSYDIEARGPLARVSPSSDLLSAALILAHERSSRSLMRVEWAMCRGAAPTAAGHKNPVLLGNSNAPCLPLLEALASGADATVIAGISPGLGLSMTLTPA